MSKGVSVDRSPDVGEANITVDVGVLAGRVATNVLEGTVVGADVGAVVEVGTDPEGAPPEPENVPELTSR